MTARRPPSGLVASIATGLLAGCLAAVSAYSPGGASIAATGPSTSVATTPGPPSNSREGGSAPVASAPSAESVPDTLPPDPQEDPTPPVEFRRPGRIQSKQAGIDALIVPIDFHGDTLAPPDDVAKVGVWDRSAPLGAAAGRTILVGHVSDTHDSPGALYRLAALRVGSHVTIRASRDVAPDTFVVTSVSRYDKSNLPQSVFNVATQQRLLTIITCGDKQTYSDGAFHYADNIVVRAVLLAPAQGTNVGSDASSSGTPGTAPQKASPSPGPV